MNVLLPYFSAIFGLLLGSFANVLILRLPKEASIGGRSACVHCGHTLQPLDLVPLLSYVWLRGRCRYCKKSISPRYFAVELFVSCAFAASAWYSSPVTTVEFLQLGLWFVLIFVGVITFIVDFEHYIILDVVTGCGSGAVLLLLLAIDSAQGTLGLTLASGAAKGILGAVLGYALFYILWYFSGGKLIGFGDVKFMLFMGLALGLPLVFVGMLFAFWIGALVSVPLLLFGSKTLKSKVPFGTFLVPALWVAAVWGDWFLVWYSGLLS